MPRDQCQPLSAEAERLPAPAGLHSGVTPQATFRALYDPRRCGVKTSKHACFKPKPRLKNFSWGCGLLQLYQPLERSHRLENCCGRA